MYEYKVLILSVKECEETFNRYAKEGWRVIAVSPNMTVSVTATLVATLERKAD